MVSRQELRRRFRLPELAAVAVAFLGLSQATGCGNDSAQEVEGPLADAGSDEPSNDSQVVPWDGLLPQLETSTAVPCNGWPVLCDRRYDEQVVATTRGAPADASPPFRYPAQRVGLRTQLDDGIRGLMLEVHETEGRLAFCSGSCLDGSSSVEAGLLDVAGFLADNPREIVTLFIDNRVAAPLIAAMFDRTKLTDQVFVRGDAAAWPTLREMIDQGRRLVVFLSDVRGAEAVFESTSARVATTRSEFQTPGEMICGLAPGQSQGAQSKLLLVYHTLSVCAPVDAGGLQVDADGEEGDAGALFSCVPDEALAATINKNPFLIGRLRGCTEEHGRRPTFVAVDFEDSSDVMGASQKLAGLVP
jgi:hypothetical protein